MEKQLKLCLHIGSGKVASSTLQKFLIANAKEIRRQGLLIADRDFRFPPAGPILDYPARIIRRWVEDPDERQAALGRALDEVWDVAQQNRHLQGAVVSSEGLENPETASWFQEARERFSVSVIYYVRRQDQLLESAWKQWALKKGRSLEDFVTGSFQEGVRDTLEVARTWNGIADNLTVTPIEAVNDVQEHFAGCCGLDFSRLDPVEPANRTFDWAILDTFSRCRFLFDDIHDNQMFEFLERTIPPEVSCRGHGLLPEDLAEEVRKGVRERNATLRREFFPDLPRCDFDDPKPDGEVSGLIEKFGSTESIYRNMGLLWAVLREMHQSAETLEGELEMSIQEHEFSDKRFHELNESRRRLSDSTARRLQRLQKNLEAERSRRKALEKRLAALERRSWRGLVTRSIRPIQRIFGLRKPSVEEKPRGEDASGREGRAELRNMVSPFAGFREKDYLAMNPDVAKAVREGQYPSGWCHYLKNGWHEAKAGVDPAVRDRIGEILEHSSDGTIPPDFLRRRVHGNENLESFHAVGEQVARRITEKIEAIGIPLEEGSRVLDFGCGCGRILVPLQENFTGCRFFGTDIDGEAILWCQTHLRSLGEFTENTHRPPLRFEDGWLDFVYSISIFTHLPEDRQFEWLQELQRVIRPGGYLITTTHSMARFEGIASETLKSEFRDAGFAWTKMGVTKGLPDYYRTAWHSEEYVQREWGRFFEIHDIVSRGIGPNQDLVVCRNRK